MSNSTLIILCFICFFNACATNRHVTFETPPKNDTALYERQEYYSKHQPIATSQFTRVEVHKSFASVIQGINYLQLKNGKRVYYPEDLKPLVKEDSVTALAINNHLENRSSAKTWKYISWGGCALGVVSPALFIPSFFSSEDDFEIYAPIAVSGLLLGGVITFVGYYVGSNYSNEALSEKETAFISFEASLKEKLGLDENGVAKHAVKQ